ncbi:LacI family DNA-binding transcriptional regulator [Clostridium lacusfryxellense]|uniref:LacI family DNA-binding transcriptional regulator n=1 Tax=Clostridium lacusfryxellense TaxID=205328 RepID=UPI001C0D1B97|nr:LacI family DNA-binding transcriptional regulator [Clostridium lacusfryxellense]MBU3113583.1 LacI family transcriptional regulator [Clostridium lacusfryxellense]
MITRKDIAEKAGVSVTIVSRALNNSGYVAKEKKEKVIRIAENMGYYPNPVSMSLQTRKTNQVAFYCKDLINSFNIEMYHGMMQQAKKRDYMVVLCGRLEFDGIKSMMVDGIIMPNQQTTKRYLDFFGKNYFLPLVTASYSDSIPLSKSVPLIDVNLFEGMRLAVDYLNKNGHFKIAFGVPSDDYNFDTARCIAYKEMLQPVFKDKILDYIFTDAKPFLYKREVISNIWEVDEDFFEKGAIAAQLFVERKPDATAIVCFNDQFALGMCRQFKKAGVRIPEDLSIVGFDGTYTRKYFDPLITTIGLFPANIGAKCIDVLLDVIEGNNNKYIVHSPVKLIEGETVKNIRK